MLVIGAGPIGLRALRLAQIAGARVVCATERIKGRAKIAEKIGADLVVNPSPGDVRPQVADFIDGLGADAVIEREGTESAFPLVIDLAPRAGVSGRSPQQRHLLHPDLEVGMLKGLEVTGVVELDFPAGMEIIRQKKMDCREFLTEITPLDRVPEAFEAVLHPVDQEKIGMLPGGGTIGARLRSRPARAHFQASRQGPGGHVLFQRRGSPTWNAARMHESGFARETSGRPS